MPGGAKPFVQAIGSAGGTTSEIIRANVCDPHGRVASMSEELGM